MTNALITGWGMYAPSRVMTNDDLAQMVDTSDEWIVSRTGIRERRIAADDETTTSLSVNASRDALAVAGVDPGEVDLIVLGTCSPDYPLPATPTTVARDLGATRAAAFDLQAACSGFVYAMATANGFIRSGMYRNVLVIGVEVLSRYLNWKDRNTCVLFGDGAGAVLVQASDQPGGISGFHLFADGTGFEGIIVPGGGSVCPATPQSVADGMHFVHMAGRDVYKYATRQMAESALAAVRDAGLRIGDIEKYGNTSAASVPMALSEAVAAGRINPGDQVLMVAFGAGYTAAAAVVEWTADPARAFLAPGSQTRLGQPQRALEGVAV